MGPILIKDLVHQLLGRRLLNDRGTRGTSLRRIPTTSTIIHRLGNTIGQRILLMLPNRKLQPFRALLVSGAVPRSDSVAEFGAGVLMPAVEG